MGVFTSLLLSGLKLTPGVVLEGLECFRVWVWGLKTEIRTISADLESFNHLTYLLRQFTTVLLTQATL